MNSKRNSEDNRTSIYLQSIKVTDCLVKSLINNVALLFAAFESMGNQPLFQRHNDQGKTSVVLYLPVRQVYLIYITDLIW